MKPDDFPDLIGQDEAISRIPDPLPPTLLLQGPRGVGKRTLARAIAHRVASGPDLHVLSEPFTAVKARAMIKHHATMPMGPRRVTVADLSGANEHALQMILKLLEDPRESRIILHHNPGGASIAGLRWRCFSVNMPLLAERDVAAVLTRLKIPDPTLVASMARGSVRAGITYAYSEEVRRAVRRVLEALRRGDGAVLEEVLNDVLDGPETYREALCAGLLNVLVRFSPETISMEAVVYVSDLLAGASRPNLKFRAAVWTLAGA